MSFSTPSGNNNDSLNKLAKGTGGITPIVQMMDTSAEVSILQERLEQKEKECEERTQVEKQLSLQLEETMKERQNV